MKRCEEFKQQKFVNFWKFPHEDAKKSKQTRIGRPENEKKLKTHFELVELLLQVS